GGDPQPPGCLLGREPFGLVGVHGAHLTPSRGVWASFGHNPGEPRKSTYCVDAATSSMSRMWWWGREEGCWAGPGGEGQKRDGDDAVDERRRGPARGRRRAAPGDPALTRGAHRPGPA